MKWLLNERALLAGDIVRLETSVKRAMAELSEKQAALAALDITIRITDERLRPNAAGVVRGFLVEYGGRGALKEAIKAELKASSEGVAIKNMAAAMAVKFGIVFPSALDKAQFIDSIKGALIKLCDANLAERIPKISAPGERQRYRWKDQAPTYNSLLEQAGHLSSTGESDANAHSS